MFENLYERLRHKIRESTLPSVQQEIKDEITPTLNLPTSRYYDEETVRKFVLLNDGSVIPVKGDHEDFLVRMLGPDGTEQFVKSGGITGGIDDATHAMSLFYDVKPTPQQIDSAVRIFIKYRGDYIRIDGHLDVVDSEVEKPDAVRYMMEFNKKLDERIQYDLNDRLLHLHEKAGLPDLQQKIKDTFKISDELAYGSFEGEENRCKAWVLNDGSVIPVDYAHADVPAEILKLEAETDEDAEDPNLPAIAYEELLASGAVRLSIVPDEYIMFGNSLTKPTEKQIETLKRLFVKFECDKLIFDVDGDWVETRIDSMERLDGVLRYGKEMAMAERRVMKVCESLPPEQAELKKRVTPSFDLNPSTWSGEESWYKFLILNDGSVIPVVKSHRGTIVGRDLVPGPLFTEDPNHYHNSKHAQTQREFYETGAVEGKFFPKKGEMDLFWDDEITDEQIESAVKLYKKYGAQTVYANDNKGAKIDTAERLEAVLRYGHEMAMAERVNESETHDKIKAKYGTVKPGDLKQSLWPGDFGRFRKFLILGHGEIVPVEKAHWTTIMGATNEEWGTTEMPPFVSQFRDERGIQGTVTTDELALYIRKGLKFSPSQIRSITQIYDKYQPKRLVIDWNEYGQKGTNWTENFYEVDIDSAARLEAVLLYGPEMATTANEGRSDDRMDEIEMALRDSLPHDQLELSKNTHEGQWVKFLILRDGTLLGVERNHADALGYTVLGFINGGGIQGRFDTKTHELDLMYPGMNHPNDEQMKTIEGLADNFRPEKLSIDCLGDTIHTKVRSTDEVVYIVKWGAAVVAAADERKETKENQHNGSSKRQSDQRRSQ